MHRAALFSLLLGLGAILGAEPSCADPVRLPATGDPAFAFDAPAGWTVAYDEQGNATLSATDHSAAVELGMLGSADAPRPVTDLAAEILKAATASPYSATGAGTIAGHASDNFYSQLIVNDTHLNVVVQIAKLDASHAAVLNILTKDNLLPAQTAALNALLAAVRLTSVK